MKKLILLFSLLLFIFSCNKKDKESQEEGYEPTSEESFGKTFHEAEPALDKDTKLDLTGMYAGSLPCEDCEGIDMKVMINSDHTYLVEETFQKGTKTETFYNIGRWKIINDSTVWLKGSALDYSGSAALWMFKYTGPDSLKVLGKGTQAKDSSQNYFLTPSSESFKPEQAFKMSGMLMEKNGHTYFKECGTQKEFKVTQKGAHEKAKQQYQTLKKENPELEGAFVIVMGYLSSDKDRGAKSSEVVITEILSADQDNMCETIDIETPPAGDRKAY